MTEHIIPVGLSTSSVAPATVRATFEHAARLGYDGVEIMVWRDPDSQDGERIAHHAREFGLPVLSLHAPTLLVSKGIMGADLWARIDRTMEMAAMVGCPVVVAHPPFVWQGDYAEEFVEGVLQRSGRDGVVLAVENMYPWYAMFKRTRRHVQVYAHGWDPVGRPYPHVTLDLSHAGTARQDSLAVARALGPRLTHVHLTDSRGSFKDEHLIPGRGHQPAAELLHHLRDTGYAGSVVLEVNTRGRRRPTRERMLRESLDFARTHLDPAHRSQRQEQFTVTRPKDARLPSGRRMAGRPLDPGGARLPQG